MIRYAWQESAGSRLTGLLGFLTFRRIVDPIQSLETSVKTITEGQYSKEVSFTAATDETGSLARSVSDLKKGAATMDEQRWAKSSAATIMGDLQVLRRLFQRQTRHPVT